MRGRPTESKIRKNITLIIKSLRKAYGYEIYYHYLKLFPEVHQRSIYYHLNKGVQLNEFIINEVKQNKGDYSWGKTTERIYYSLGKNANAKDSKKVENYFSKIKSLK